MTETLAYLREVLSLQPSEHAGRIVELRRGRAQREHAPGVSPVRRAPEADRTAAEAALDAIITELYDGDASELARSLTALELAAFPDLDRRRTRLVRVLDAREEIDAAFLHPKTDDEFAQDVLRILAMRQRDAAELKARVLARMNTRARRGKVRKTIAVWKQAFPALYALEADWFGQLARAKSILRDRRKPLGCMVWIAIWFLIKLIQYLSKN